MLQRFILVEEDPAWLCSRERPFDSLPLGNHQSEDITNGSIFPPFWSGIPTNLTPKLPWVLRREWVCGTVQNRASALTIIQI